MSGASTNPDPDVFAYSAATIKANMDVTKRLGGANYVLWGGREGYETLLNTKIGQELDQMARMLTRWSSSTSTRSASTARSLIEPKPQEPSKHQYDYDVGDGLWLPQEVRARERRSRSISKSATPSSPSHTFEHEIALAAANGISRLDRHEPQRPAVRLGYRPVPEQCARGCAWPITTFSRPAWLRNRRHQFRRQGPAPVDRSDRSGLCPCRRHGHVCPRLSRRPPPSSRTAPTTSSSTTAMPAGTTPEAQAMLKGERTLEDIAKRVEEENIDPQAALGPSGIS